MSIINSNHNRKLDISTAPTKARSREPACSQALVQNKIDRQRVRSRESGRQTARRLWWMVFGVETGREVWRREWEIQKTRGEEKPFKQIQKWFVDSEKQKHYLNRSRWTHRIFEELSVLYNKRYQHKRYQHLIHTDSYIQQSASSILGTVVS